MTRSGRGPLALAVGMALTVPSAVVVGAPEAAAAQQVLRVVALDRAGQPREVEAWAVNVSTTRSHRIPPGGSVRVAAGTYAVGTVIPAAADSSEYEATVAARSVAVQSAVTVTFDARQGRKVPVAIADDAGATEKVVLLQTVLAGYGTMPTVTPPNATYVVPDASKHVRLFARAVLTYPNGAGAVRYDLVRETASGLPGDLGLTPTRSQLARVDLQARTLDAGQNVQFQLTPKTSFPQAYSGYIAPLTFRGPNTLVSYRSPGTTWAMDLRYLGGLNPVSFGRTEPARPAGRSTQIWGGAVWGPHAPAIPPAVLGSRLTILLGSPLCRAQKRTDRTRCSMSNTQGTIKLYKGGRLLDKYPAPNSQFGVSVPISSAAALYKMTIGMHRKRGAQLASAMTGEWVFRASGTTKLSRPKLGMPRLDVAGLDISNAAARSSTSVISVGIDGWRRATGLVVESSVDGGKSWTKAAAKATGTNRWTVSVRNPSQGGFVTIRVRAADGSGQSVRVTYRNAYRVS